MALKHANQTSFVKGDIRLVGKKQSFEHKEKRLSQIRRRLFVNCDNCNKQVEVIPYVKTHRKYHFCNKECYMKWNHRIGYNIRPLNWSEKGKQILQKVWSKNGQRSKISFLNKTKQEKENWIRIMRINQTLRPNKPETLLKNIIEKNKLDYKYTGDGKFWIENFNPDFINCNGKKVILEVFGDYWHNLDKIKIRDEKKLEVLKKYGWDRIILWEREIYSLSEQEIVNRIKGVSYSSA